LLYEPIEIIFLDKEKGKQVEISISAGESLKTESLEDINVQERLIGDFFKPRNLSEEKIDKIFQLNKQYDIKFDEGYLRNIQYKIEKMKFYNLFSYGENNEFDFTKYKGIVGVFGKNRSG
jgi:hypothetical protein